MTHQYFSTPYPANILRKAHMHTSNKQDLDYISVLVVIHVLDLVLVPLSVLVIMPILSLFRLHSVLVLVSDPKPTFILV